MSTISEALKKVQKQRAAGLPPPRNTRPDPSPGKVPLPAEPVAPPREEGRPVSASALTGIVIAILGVLLAVYMVWGRGGSKGVQTPSKPVQMAGTAIHDEAEVLSAAPARIATPPPDLPVLSGVFYSDQNPVAMIGDSALKEGETIGAYRVMKILPRGVIVKSKDGEFELRVR